MIPRLKPRLGWQEALAAFSPSHAQDVERFEAQFAAKAGQKHAIAFPYGRTGLALLLEALGMRGKEILCPAYTCVVVPHAIVISGNEPVFIDSQESDFNMNLELAQEAVNERTGAIVATSIFGYPVNLDQLAKFRQRHPDICIVQDCAHSFMTQWHGQLVHKAGVAAFFGLNISKLITSIFGGMVSTDDDDLAAKLREVRRKRIAPPTWSKTWQRRMYLAAVYPAFSPLLYGFTHVLERRGALGGLVKYYDEAAIDMPKDFLSGLTPVEARVGCVQLKRYDAIVAHRRGLAQWYAQQLQGLTSLRLPPLVEGATYSHYVPRVKRREEIMARAGERGVQLGWLIEYCIPLMAAYRKRSGSRFEYPIAGQMARETINLPMQVSLDQAGKVVSTLKAIV